MSLSRPEIRNIEDFWCWLNTWGERDAHHGPWRAGYEAAIRDAMDALEKAGVGYEQVPDEAWMRWTGHEPREVAEPQRTLCPCGFEPGGGPPIKPDKDCRDCHGTGWIEDEQRESATP